MSNNITELVSKLRESLAEAEEAESFSHDDSEAGEGEAENISDVNDALDDYILSIADSLLDEYDIDADEAVDFVFDVVASLEEEGTLPPLPDESEEVAVAEWLGKATTMGFGELVLAAMESSMGEEDSEEESEMDSAEESKEAVKD